MDTQIRHGLEGSEISLLTLRLRYVSGTIDYSGGEVAYSTYVVIRQQQARQLTEIQPTIRGAPQGKVVQIKPVDIDASTNGSDTST